MLVLTLLERETSCLQTTMLAFGDAYVTQPPTPLPPTPPPPLQCLFGIPVSCGCQNVNAEYLT